MKAGLSPLWVVIGAAVVLVGGSVAITVAWGVRHLYWALVIGLVLLAVLIFEGSYRQARRVEKGHADEFAAEREAHRAALEAATVQAGSGTPREPAVSSGLEVVIKDQHPTPFPGDALILEIEFDVTDHDPVGHTLSVAMRNAPLYFAPSGQDGEPVHRQILSTFDIISKRRLSEKLPPHINAGETVRGVLVTTFAWKPGFHKLPDYTLIISDGYREYEARPSHLQST